MSNHETELERDRMFRYVISRFSTFGPQRLLDAKAKIKEKTMETCRLGAQEYEDLFEDLRKELGK